MLGQEPGGGLPVRGLIVAVGKADQPEEPVGQRFAVGWWLARGPGTGGHDLDVVPHPVPASETVLAGEDELGGGQREPAGRRRIRVPSRHPDQRGRLAAAHGALKLPGLVAKLVQIRVLGERGGRHRSLLSLCRPVRYAGRKESLNDEAVRCPSMGGLCPFRGPGGAPRATRILPGTGVDGSGQLAGLAHNRRKGGLSYVYMQVNLVGEILRVREGSAGGACGGARARV